MVEKSKWWGVWSSIFFSLLIIFSCWMTWISIHALYRHFYPQALYFNLLNYANTTITASTFLLSMCIAFVIIFLLIKIRGNDLQTYLAIRKIKWQPVAILISIIIIYIEYIHSFMLARPPLTLFAYLIIYPIFIEVLIRGFLYTGIEKTKGPILAISISTLFWLFTFGKLPLLLYGFAYGFLVEKSFITLIFKFSGIVLLILCSQVILGFIRYRTGSLYPSMIIMLIISMLSFFLPTTEYIHLIGLGFDAAQLFFVLPTAMGQFF